MITVKSHSLRPTPHWVTSLFDLDFRSAKVRSKYRLQPKSEVISLSLSLSGNFGLSPKFLLSESLSPKVRSKYILRLKFS